MKKQSGIIVLVVLLVSALFIACNSDVASSTAGDMAVYTVKIADNNSKGLTGTSASSIKAAGDLYWYYTATKADNSVYTIGATSGMTAIDGNSETTGIQPGLVGASLGEFSQGYWTFQFWGYENASDVNNIGKEAVYYSNSFVQAVFTDVSLTVELVKGDGIPDGTVKFYDIKSSAYNFNSGDSKELTLTVKEGSTIVASSTATADANGVATFTLASITPSVAQHTYTFEVAHTVSPSGLTPYTEVIGENNITVTVQKGVEVTITGTIDQIVTKYTVTVGDYTAPVATQASAVFSSESITGDVTVQAQITPAAATTGSESDAQKTTKVTFPAETYKVSSEDTSSIRLDMQVENLDTASQFAIEGTTSDNDIAVATVQLKLVEVSSSGSETPIQNPTFSPAKPVIVETYISSGLEDVLVGYKKQESSELVMDYEGINAGGSAPIYKAAVLTADDLDNTSKLGYYPATGFLRFTTTHFTDFVVGSSTAVVNTTINKGYKTLPDAVTEATSGAVLKLIKNVALSSMITLDKTLTVEINGKTLSAANNGKLFQIVNNATLTINGETAGSASVGRYNVGTSGNNNGNLVLIGGSYSIANNTVVHVNEKCKNSNVSISNATLTSTGDNGVQFNGGGVFTITGSNITGATAVYVKGGAVSITNSTITGNFDPVAIPSVNHNGSNPTGDGIVLDTTAGYPGDIRLSLTNSTVSGTGYGIGEYVLGNLTSSQTKSIVVNGGSLSSLRVSGLFAANTSKQFAIKAGTVFENSTLIADITVFEAANTTKDVGYFKLDNAINGASAGDTVAVLCDISASGAFIIDKNLTIEGNGKTITTSNYQSSDARSINVGWHNSNIINVTIKDLRIVGPTGGYSRGLNIGNSYVNLTLKNCYVSAGHYPINVTPYGDNFTLTANYCEISGWCALNIWSHHNNITINNSVLTGTNNKSVGPSNNFATICFESDTTYETNEYGWSNKITVNNSTIKAIEENSNIQAFVAFNKGITGANDCILELNNCELFKNDSATSWGVFIGGYGNKLIIDGVTEWSN